MSLVHPNSLSKTLDAINEALFLGKEISKAQRDEAARWLAERQGQPGSYAGMFAPTEHDYSGHASVFTGEPIRSGAATGHILGEEACRALRLLNAPVKAAREALQRAEANMLKRLEASQAEGHYCCGICSCSYWRNAAAGSFNRHERRLAAGLKLLKQNRLPNHRWKRFPFYYVLLALSEMQLPAATDEMKHAAPACERILRRKPAGTWLNQRHRLLAERVLSRC